MKWCIYKHTNKFDGFSYIGLTCREPEKRWGYNGNGYKKNDIRFYNAIQKYGWENFTHEILEDNIPTIDMANEREKYYINLYRTFVGFEDCKGYNLTLGGDGTVGYRHTSKARTNISKNNGRYWKGKQLHPNTVEGQKRHRKEHPECYSRKGFKLSPESIQKGKETRRKYYETHDGARKGTHPTEATLRKLRESHIGQKAWNKGKTMPKEYGEKVTKGLLKYYETHTRKGNNFTEDAKRRISESVSKANTGKKFVNNGKINKFVTKEVAEQYIAQGWVYGRLSTEKFRESKRQTSKGRKWIHKGEDNKFVKVEELEKYFSQGYELGPFPKHSQKGTIMMIKDGNFTKIYPEQLEEYLELGWERSHIFCKKKVSE